MSKDVDTVLKCLEKVNRPYSVNDVVQNLQNEITKSAVQKTLDLLVSRGKVREKIFNKQKIYAIVQNATSNANVQQEVHGLEAQVIFNFW
jgi:26S proteasome regulatory subunit (ATPase 3-interacting protein)